MTEYAGSLDTNVLLRAILNDIPEQHDAAKELIERAGVKYRVCDTALIEMAFVLERHYGFSRQHIKEALAGVTAHPRLSCNADIINNSAEDFATHPALSFEDCYLAQSAKEAEALPLWTFERKLAGQSEYSELLTRGENKGRSIVK
ncbi:MAG: PIN domain-containing protein [Coriobacteriia bacterium]|nr:PIN domain-containing protein [Coriobacteriia bacterium]